MGQMVQAREAASAGLGDAVVLGELLRVAVSKAGEASPTATAAVVTAKQSGLSDRQALRQPRFLQDRQVNDITCTGFFKFILFTP